MADLVKRLHYFDHQFLCVDDFRDEQEYHMGMRRLHNCLLHTWGVAEGLALSFKSGASIVTVSQGVAVDDNGREIVLAEDTPTPDLSGYEDKTVYITIAYSEEETDPTTETSVSGKTRVTEKPEIRAAENPPSDPSQELILGRVTVDQNGKISGTDEGAEPYKRRFVGAVAGDLEARRLTLSSPDVVSSEWPTLSCAAAGRADLTGDLSVSGHVGIGTTSPGAKLEVGGELKATEDNQELVGLKIAPSFKDDGKKDVKHYGLIVKSGNVGIGTTRPNARLHIQGEQKTGTGKIKSSGTSVTGGATGVNKTQFTSQLEVGDLIVVGDQTRVITAIASDTQLTIDRAFSPAFSTLTAFTFRPPLTRLADSGGATQFLVNASGNVGIGTTTPRSKLHVAGDVLAGNDENNQRFIFHTRTTANGDFLQITHDKSDGDWDWNQGITLKRGGNVGIGTQDPQAKLDVNGFTLSWNPCDKVFRTGEDNTGESDSKRAKAILKDKPNGTFFVAGPNKNHPNHCMFYWKGGDGNYYRGWIHATETIPDSD